MNIFFPVTGPPSETPGPSLPSKVKVLELPLAVYTSGLSNLSAMAGRIDFILGMAGQYAISAAIKAMAECDFLNVLI